jgi:hypothetical protein
MPDDPAERYRKNAEVCRHRAAQALKPEDKARWLKSPKTGRNWPKRRTQQTLIVKAEKIQTETPRLA